MGDDMAQLREEARGLAARVERLSARARGATPLLAVRVFAETAVPTETGLFYATHPVDVVPGAAEGDLATLTPRPETVYVAVVAGKVPAAGDYLAARGVPDRWASDLQDGGIKRTLRINGRDCAGTLLTSGSVRVTGPGGFDETHALAAVPGTAVKWASFTIPAAGSYPWVLTSSGLTCGGTAVFGTFTTSVVQGCCVNSFGLTVTPTTVCGVVRNYCAPLAGLTVTARQLGTDVATTTTDGTGHFCMCVRAGVDLQIVVAGSGRYQETTRPVRGLQLPGCSTLYLPPPFDSIGSYHTYQPAGDIIMLPAPGFAYGICCPHGEPAPATLNASDADYGAVTLSILGPTGTIAPQSWRGTKVVDYPGCDDRPYEARTTCPEYPGVTAVYTLAGCELTVSSGTFRNTTGGIHSCPIEEAFAQDHPAASAFAGTTGVGPVNLAFGGLVHPLYCHHPGSVLVTE